jgi:predicted nucleic acid-binding protein
VTNSEVDWTQATTIDSAVDTLNDGLPVRPRTSGENFQDFETDSILGEAASLHAASNHRGTLATDDLAARKAAEQRDLPFTGSIDLLVIGARVGQLKRETADAWLDTWREQRGYYVPVVV